MPAYTRKERDALEALQTRLDALHIEMSEALHAFNSAAEDLWDEIAAPAVAAYEEMLEDIAGTLSDMAEEFEEAVEDLPLRMQEDGDDNGWADMARALREGARAFEPNLLKCLDGPAEIEPYDPVDALGTVLMELGEPEG